MASWRTSGWCSLEGRRGVLISAAMLLVAVLLAYARALEVPFLFDDYPAVVRNESIRTLAPSVALNPPTSAAGAAARPVVNYSLAIDYAFGGASPPVYHATNVALHAITAFVLCLLLRGVLRKTSAKADANALAMVVALLWAVHPLATETVVCVIQRNEILVALFALVVLRSVAGAADGAHPRVWMGVGVASGILAAGSKEVAAVVPLLTWVFDRTFFAGGFGQAWRARKPLYVGLAGTWGIVAILVVQNQARAGTVGFGLGVSTWDYALTQARALIVYVKLLVWPHPLVLDYGAAVVARPIEVLGPATALALAFLVAVRGVWRGSAAAFPIAAFFLLLAPSSSFVPLTTQTIAEHRMYLPSAALLTALVLALYRVAPRRPATHLFITAVLVALLGSLTSARVRLCTDEIALWRDTIAHAPANARAQASLASAYVRRGEWPEAVAAYRDAIGLNPRYADAHNDLAYALEHSDDLDGAINEYRAAIALKPGDAEMRYNYGSALARAGRSAEAIAQLETTLAARPDFVAAEVNLAETLRQVGDVARAVATLRRVVAQEPGNRAARRALALALQAAGSPGEAVEQFRTLVALDPTSADAHNDLGLAFCEQHDLTAAESEFSAALRLNPRFVGARVNLANVGFARGDIAGAAQQLAAAVQLAPENPELRYNHGATLARLGRTREAETEFRAALRLRPDFPPAREALKSLASPR